MRWGEYEHFEDFLRTIATARRSERETAEAPLPLPNRRASRRHANRDVVEIEAEIEDVLPDDEQGAKHQLLRVKVLRVEESDPDVDEDLKRSLEGNETVIVSIRYGDRMGLEDRVPDLEVGTRLYLRGEWIPASRAYAHGGERSSVLHFTHAPIGFVCTPSNCFS